ncbi:hypothetical protein ACLBXM_09215 [Xanthobacteraceae bacterium A53D]
MARFLSPAALAAYRNGRVGERTLIQIDLADATYGFWDGTDILEYGGITYVGAGRLLSVDDVSSGTDGGDPLTLHLAAVPASGLSMDVLSQIEEHDYHQRPARVSTAAFGLDGSGLLGVSALYGGYIDVLSHEDTVGGAGEIVCSLESRSRDLTLTGYRINGDADQRLIAANDGFFRHAATAGDQTINWGAKPGKAS